MGARTIFFKMASLEAKMAIAAKIKKTKYTKNLFHFLYGFVYFVFLIFAAMAILASKLAILKKLVRAPKKC